MRKDKYSEIQVYLESGKRLCVTFIPTRIEFSIRDDNYHASMFGAVDFVSEDVMCEQILAKASGLAESEVDNSFFIRTSSISFTDDVGVTFSEWRIGEYAIEDLRQKILEQFKPVEAKPPRNVSNETDPKRAKKSVERSIEDLQYAVLLLSSYVNHLPLPDTLYLKIQELTGAFFDEAPF